MWHPQRGSGHPDPSPAPGPNLPSTLWAVAPALSLPPAPELAWLHRHHHLTLPYLCLGGATPSRFSLHELEDPCELYPIPYPVPYPTPAAPAVLCTLYPSAAPPRLGQRTDSLRPWLITVFPGAKQGVWGPSPPQGVSR